MLSPSPSTFGKPGLKDFAGLNRSLESLLENVKNLDKSPSKPETRLPSVVSRLTDKKGKYYKRRKSAVAKSSKTKSQHTPKKPHEIRVVGRPHTPLDDNPGAAHYKPNFDAVLTQEPQISFPKAKDHPNTSSLEEKSMNEMLNTWSSNLRAVDFQQPKDTKKVAFSPLPPSSVMNAKTYVMSRSLPCDRDSFMKVEKTPAPNYYNVKIIEKHVGAIPFAMQASRNDYKESFENPIRDTRAAIDATIKRQPRQVPFDKQSSREKKAKEEDPMWKKIEEEQKEILSHMANNAPQKKKVKIKTADFAKQTRDERSPFYPFMRKEWEPSKPYDVERGLKYLERPKTAFNISQKSFKYDRQIYNKTDAPDVIYGNSNDYWKNTQPDVSTPIMESYHVRRDPYYYMPHPCGEEDSRPLWEIAADEMYVASHSKIKVNRPKMKGKPEPMERYIDTPLSLKRNKSPSSHRYDSTFGINSNS